MTFVEFYGESTGWNGKDFSGPVQTILMTGSDSWVRLDGRKKVENLITDARRHALKHNKANVGHKITHLVIKRGDLLRSRPIGSASPMPVALYGTTEEETAKILEIT